MGHASMTLPGTGQTSESDEVLVARAKQDPHAFAPLYQRYQPQIHAFVRGRVADSDLAADITSQVFVRALAALPSYRDGPFRAWLYTIARNLIIDAQRRTRPTVALDSEVHAQPAEHAPEHQALAGETRRTLHAALETLVETQRQIVLLRLQGLDGHEIAKALNISYAAMKSAQYRAFARLREELGTDREVQPGQRKHP